MEQKDNVTVDLGHQNQKKFYKELETQIRTAKKEKLFLKNTVIQDNNITIEIEGDELSGFDKLELLLSQKNGDILWTETIDFNQVVSGTITVDLNKFVKTFFKSQYSKWSVDILGLKKKESFLFSMKKESKDKEVDLRNKSESLIGYFGDGEFEKVCWCMYGYYNRYNTLLFDVNYKFKSYTQFVQGEVRKVTISGGRIKINAELEDCGMKPIGMIGRRRLTKAVDLNGIKFNCKVKQKDTVTYITGELDLSEFEFTSDYIDIFLLVEKDGFVYDLFLNTKNKRINKKFQKLFRPIHYKIDEENILFPYTTVSSNLAFDCRKIAPYDKFAFRLKERIARVIFRILKKKMEQKNIMLVYEKYCEAAQENGFYFFQYCMENGMEKYMKKEIYFVIDYNSSQYENVKQYGNRVLNYLSIKHMVYLQGAKLLVSSETKSHSYVRRSNATSIRRRLDNTPSVFLQHGVIAFKQLPFMIKSNRNSRTNLFITSSFIEKGIILDKFEYDENEVAVTGLARWDLIEDKSDTCREILLMPTWRRDLEEVSDEEFQESEYFLQYMHLLNSERLYTILEQNNLHLNFYIHPQLRRFIGKFSSTHPNIHLIPFGEEPLNELIMRCSLMITDYSSAIWDVYYQGKPALFYQFDFNEYNYSQGSYFDLETELFGDVSYKQEDLLARIEEMITREFKEKEEYAKLREEYLPYIDHNNRKRTCDAILKAGL
ncbi:CDP-glycerol glycerophosphotransferase family protein [Anaerosacchariphilus polymeriproducens]|uniref:Teichoic acid biosynthesis protein TagF n=1 Tax=Anaerosacchariphilus polymeriproducens TaxID=1812858 RepID=A0A371AR94_9FIRM|nr:CDP-glycerol glycerophosphotransferase family protein [Anaerosacchariphilus polymeriproducens]RDU22101.1 hypothetical protein DWV06_16360 [Anaerosacchariphilus polymeriproducens]